MTRLALKIGLQSAPGRSGMIIAPPPDIAARDREFIRKLKT